MSQLQERRAKTVCTLGPASSDPEVISALIGAGMNVARLNMSHGSQEDHTKVFEAIPQGAAARGVAVAVLADLQGPKIRVGKFENSKILLVAGESFILDAKCAMGCGCCQPLSQGRARPEGVGDRGKPQKPSPPEGGFDRTVEHLRCWCIVFHAPISFQENYMADSFGANLMAEGSCLWMKRVPRLASP